MTTLIIITLAFLVVMIIVFTIGITFSISMIKKDEVDKELVSLAMFSVLGLIWSIISYITFCEVLT